MVYYRRRLPHWVPDQVPVFVTWRLAGSMPRTPPVVLAASPVAPARGAGASSAGRKFVAVDGDLDRDQRGPRWLADARIAEMVTTAVLYGDAGRQLYHLYAYVIMPNHVHVVWQPCRPLCRIMEWLKGTTARRANRFLGRREEPFWQDESYDHWIRTETELNRIIRYVERNPVGAGLVDKIEDWPWSSAGDRHAGRQPARPTAPLTWL